MALLFAALLTTPRLGAETEPPEPAVVEAIEVSMAGGRAEVRISSDTELDLVGVRVDYDALLSLQLPMHVLGPEVEDLFPEEGLIRAVRCTVQQTSRGPLARIVIIGREPIAHDLSADDRQLRLRLWPADAEPQDAALRRQVAELEAALTAAETTRDDLARRFEAMAAEGRRRVLETPQAATLSEETELLRGLRAETQELAAQLRQAGQREGELARRVAQLEASLAESEAARAQLAARLERATAARPVEPPPAPAPVPTVRLGNVSPEGFGGATPAAADASEPSAADAAPAAGDDHHFIVAASSNEERSALALSARLRDRGYASEVYWSDSGYYVVTLGWLPYGEAREKRDQAVRTGDVAADAYLIRGTTLSKRDPAP